MTVQAESADAAYDTTAGNTWNLYRGDDLDVQPTADAGGGWNVGLAAAGEWEQWKDVPMQGTEGIQVRVATPNSGTQLQFIIDGVAGPVTDVPNTGGWQTRQTVHAGTFQFNPGTYHTVQIHYLTGGLNVNWWKATSLGQAVISLRGHANGMLVTAENAGASPLIANRTAVGSWETSQLVHNADGGVSLKAEVNNTYVTAENAGASPFSPTAPRSDRGRSSTGSATDRQPGRYANPAPTRAPPKHLAAGEASRCFGIG